MYVAWFRSNSNLEDIEKALQAHGKYTAAILLEPIQGEAG
jgi:acetylornithine/succinyldiaminopimelate/putrescine aminotransferase